MSESTETVTLTTEQAYEISECLVKMASIFAKASGKPLPTNLDGKKKHKAPVDPNFPKKPESAYLAFSRDYRQVLKNEEPDLAPKDVMTKAAAAWKEANEDIRQKYDEEAAKKMSQYKEEVAKYKAEKEKTGSTKADAGPSVSSDEDEEDREESPTSSQHKKKKKVKAAVDAADESNLGSEKKKKSRKPKREDADSSENKNKKKKKSS